MLYYSITPKWSRTKQPRYANLPGARVPTQTTVHAFPKRLGARVPKKVRCKRTHREAYSSPTTAWTPQTTSRRRCELFFRSEGTSPHAPVCNRWRDYGMCDTRGVDVIA